ncbi:cell division protein FtsQ, partial [Pelagibacteraceae bacterium]|nr:cell division protein FtsQ [Pelagibacteraceae bacterium]
NLPNLISNLNIHYPEILLSVKEMEFIEQRRWNLIFSNELIVKLPEANIGKSLENLKKLIERDKILKSNIIEVDLRINDRAIIKIDGDKLKVNIEEV